MRPARPSFAVLVGFLVAAVIAACEGGPSGSPIRMSHPTTLAGSVWQLVAIGGRSVAGISEPSLVFADEELSGDGGCNAFGGPYTYDPATGAVAIGDLISTKRACVEAARNEIEEAYLQLCAAHLSRARTRRDGSSSRAPAPSSCSRWVRSREGLPSEHCPLVRKVRLVADSSAFGRAAPSRQSCSSSSTIPDAGTVGPRRRMAVSARRSDGRALVGGNLVPSVRNVRAPQRRVAGNARPS